MSQITSCIGVIIFCSVEIPSLYAIRLGKLLGDRMKPNLTAKEARSSIEHVIDDCRVGKREIVPYSLVPTQFSTCALSDSQCLGRCTAMGGRNISRLDPLRGSWRRARRGQRQDGARRRRAEDQQELAIAGRPAAQTQCEEGCGWLNLENLISRWCRCAGAG